MFALRMTLWSTDKITFKGDAAEFKMNQKATGPTMQIMQAMLQEWEVV